MKLVLEFLIEDFLPVCHGTHDVNLSFGPELTLHVAFDSSKHERLEDFMKSLDVLLIDHLVACSFDGRRLNVLGEPFLELLMAVEELRHDEVQESPELSHGVLNWSS
jgi:hypothetical protein